MQSDDEKFSALEARMTALEKQVAALIERDKSVSDAELALAEGGAI